MKTTYSLLFLAAMTAGFASADILYDNTHHDQGDTLFYSSGNYLEIGDQVYLGASQWLLESATLQLFNDGTAGTFDATLRFYEVGLPDTPVGAMIGSPVWLPGQSAPSLSAFNLTFGLPGIAVPGQFIVTLAASNVTVGADLGLDLFDPPVVGASDNTFLITRDAGGFSRTGTAYNDANMFLVVEGETGVPEPSTGYLAAGAILIALGKWRARGRRR
jgi:hypothetical protein